MTGFVPTPEQDEVISHPLQPLRVAAGAGTGKTATVAHRVAHLITTHGVEPEQILGITFTNKAAGELADRIRAVLDSNLDPGREVEVHTYHGFAATILREFGSLVGVERDSAVITPTFTRQMLSSIVRHVDLPRLRATWAGEVDSIRRLAAHMGDHLVDPDDFGVIETDDPEDPWFRRADLVTAIRVYAAEKLRLGVVDYADLLAATHRLLTEHQWVTERIASRYRAVFLDEYQDTNPAQRIVLTTIFGPGFPITAVGDPDQTIYEWRGASPANFSGFPNHFPRSDGSPATTLTLTENRRSGAAILDLANAIRKELGSDPAGELTPIDRPDAGSVEVDWFADSVAEADWIADRILDLHDQGTTWRDIAVLFRKTKHIGPIREALAARDIPVEVANVGGLLAIPEVVEIHAWLRVLEDPHDAPALARLLTGSRYRLGVGDLALLARWVRAHSAAFDDDHDRLPPDTLITSIDHLDEVEGLRTEAREALEDFRRLHRELLQIAQSTSLVELCRMILDRTGAWLNVEAMSASARLSARLNLYRFLDLAESWSPLEGRPSLLAFLDYLQTVEDEPADQLDSARLAGADAVTLLTVHRAKGLEWPVVFVPAANRGNFPSKVVGSYDDPDRRPESLPFDLRLDRDDLAPLESATGKARRDLLAERHMAQEWRVAYVAVTRARRMVAVTGAYWYGHPEPTKRPTPPSRLYELAAATAGRELPSGDPPQRPDTLGYRSGPLPAPDPAFGTDGWQAVMRSAASDPSVTEDMARANGLTSAYDAAVAEYRETLFNLPESPREESGARPETSVTGMVTYAQCPRRYYWSEVDRLPRRFSAAARRGTDIHRRIELHHRGIVPLEDLETAIYDVPTESGETGPDPYSVFEDSRFAKDRPFLVEAPFELQIAGLWVRGRVDAIYREGDNWEIVDFKSGRPPEEGPSWVQLQAYALAASRVGFEGAQPSSLRVTYAYLGRGLTEHGVDVDAGWLSAADSTLSSISESIRAEEFDPRPTRACRSCDFLRFCDAGRSWIDEQESE